MKLIVAIMTLFLGASIAMAQPAANSEAAATRAAQHLERLSVLLDLTDTQKLQEQHAKMKALHDQMKASGQKPSFEQMKATREQMHTQTLAAMKPLLSAD